MSSAVVGLFSVGLWAFTFGWMWVSYYFFHIEGQLYALYPLAILTEVIVQLWTAMTLSETPTRSFARCLLPRNAMKTPF